MLLKKKPNRTEKCGKHRTIYENAKLHKGCRGLALSDPQSHLRRFTKL